MPMRARVVPVALVLLVLPFLMGRARVRAAQTDAAFEVISIKPVMDRTVPPTGRGGFLTGGMYRTRTNVLNLLAIAYRPAGPGSLGIDHIDASRVGSWASSALFDVEAKVSSVPPGWGTSDEVDQPMFRALLRDRFKAQVHYETRELPVYWMTVAKSDGTLGPNMKRNAAYDCDEINRLRRENPSALPPPNPSHPICTVMLATNLIAGGSVAPALLAQALRGPVGAPLVDRTGLQGFFDIDIHYTPDRTISGNDTVIPEYPTLITAIQEQLGLKLEQHREPQQVLVVDHIEMPTPD